MHVVAVLALDGVVPFDLATPCEVFGRVRLADGRPAYDVRVCSVGEEVDAGAFRMRPPWRLATLRAAGTVILPGINDITRAPAPEVVRAIRRASVNGARIASICSGAFTLAATGLLDGQRATTHWLAAAELARRHTRITVDPNVLFVDAGNILTSAGAAAGLDLCLHMVRRDHGSAVAADAARLSVMPLERAGGQAQFIVHAPPTPDGSSLEPVVRWLEQNDSASLTLRTIAQRAAMSTRTLCRRFREQLGTTPLQYLLAARVRRGQHLLETTDDSVERIATKVGFGSATTFRTSFHRNTGTSPRAYRGAFRAS